MKETDRKHYSPRNPYMDAPQPIGGGVTISAPHMVTPSQDIEKQIVCSPCLLWESMPTLKMLLGGSIKK